MIGANFPDIDVIAVPFGKNFEWRRGNTHGFLALAILPFVLAGIMWLIGRARHSSASTSAAPSAAPTASQTELSFRQLVLLSAVSIWTHPTLDYMNSYGMRWLMPFVDKWFYADGLFIIDPWIIVALGAGIWASRRMPSVRPARIALASVAGYVLLMLGITELGRREVGQQVRQPSLRMMVAPVPAIPWRREMIVDDGPTYELGTFDLFRGVTLSRRIANGSDSFAVASVRRIPEAQAFMNWVRFPVFAVSEGRPTRVRVWDARYYGQEWSSITVTLP